MAIDLLAKYLAEFLASFPKVDANVVATLVAGGIGALAVLLAALISRKVLMKQIELNEQQDYDRQQQDQNQHYERLDQDKQLHQEQLDQNKQQHQAQGLLAAFTLLDNPKHRESRETIYKLYFHFLYSNNVQVFSQTATGDIMADFDVIGKLVEKDNISVNEFLNVYGSLAYRCWKILEIHIREERKKRGLEKFMSNFEGLAIDGYIYWDEVECEDIDDTILYNTNPEPPYNTPRSITIKKIIENTENYFSKSDSSR